MSVLDTGHLDRAGSLFKRSAPTRGLGVRLVDVDPDLGDALPPAEYALAREHLVVPAFDVPAGHWSPAEELSRQLAILVVTGLVTRDGMVLDRPDLQLFGPGDVVDARMFAAGDARWRALLDTRFAVLDGRLALGCRRWPSLFAGITRRMLDGHREQHLLAAVAVLPRVEDRLLALLGHLAERWGTVSLDGLVLDLPLTHEALGRLVGARRPTVSLAIAELAAHGRVVRRGDGRWLLLRQRTAAREPRAGIAPLHLV